MTTEKGSFAPPLLILVRHGETDFNVERRFQGQMGVPLNDRGRQQAARAGQYLAALLGRGPGERSLNCLRMLTSDLPRASETASILASHLQLPFAPQPEPKLREIDVGIFQGFTFEEASRHHPNVVADYMTAYDKDPQDTPYPGGESRRDVVHRILDCFASNQRMVLDEHSMHQMGALKNSWHDRELWGGVACEIWVSHGAAMGILLQELGLTHDKPKIDNTDCLVVGHFRTGAILLHHASSKG
jgi:broad specificity phosphatase PhoE